MPFSVQAPTGFPADTWPAYAGDPMSIEPMPVPWMEHIPRHIPLTRGRQLFIDDYLIASTDLKRNFYSAVKFAGNPVLCPSTPQELSPVTFPWMDEEKDEQALCYLGNGGIFFDAKKNRYNMFYTAGWRGGLAVAESTDMLNWTRSDIDGKGNILLAAGANAAGFDNSIWLDNASSLDDERIKYMVCRNGLAHTLSTSSDGRSWSQGVPTGPAGDYCSFFYNPFRNVWAYSIKQDGPRGRCRWYSESPDFLTGADWASRIYWTSADRYDLPDPAIGAQPQLYHLNACAYESIMIGMFMLHLGPENDVCVREKRPKTTLLSLGFSRDGFHWHRPNRLPFIAATHRDGDWDRDYLHSPTGMYAIYRDTLYFPYTGFSGMAPNGVRGMYCGASIGIASLRRDGFASMDADGQGTLTTRPLIVSGHSLFVNTQCETGSLRVAICDEDGNEIPRYGKAVCDPISADSTCHAVRWKETRDVSAVSGEAIRLRFSLRNGKLFSFWVSSDEAGGSNGYYPSPFPV